MATFQPGNQMAARKHKFAGAIRRYLAQNPEALRNVVTQLFAKAEAGDVAALREIADRLDGKSLARSELAGPGGSALFPVTAINVVGVEPAAIVISELQRLAQTEPASD